MAQNGRNRHIYMLSLVHCTHKSWVPTPLASELYEQCRDCGFKRYRDPSKRRQAETYQAPLPEQSSMFGADGAILSEGDEQ
jgi:hypothetical protein